MPKRGKDGKYIDHHTNTPEDAGKFEEYYNSDPPEDHRGDYEDAPVCPECSGDLDDECCEDCGWEDDPCKCSDPCCPCTGSKRGVP